MLISNAVSAADMDLIRSISGRFLDRPADLPVSFRAGEAAYSGLPDSFRPRKNECVPGAGISETRFTGTVPGSDLQVSVTCREYSGYPVLEWVMELTNTGDADSPQITDLTGMNGFLPGLHPVLIHNNGDTCQPDLYTDSRTDLDEVRIFTQQPDGGRGSDCALPYYRVLCDEFSYNLSIGWPGQWTAEFAAAPGGFSLKAKQQYTDFYLRPGETVRTPGMTVMIFRGGEERAVNLWRRFMFDHIIPKPGGKPIGPCLSLGYRDFGEEYTQATEKKQLDAVSCFVNNGIRPDNLWIDAGWYPCQSPDGKTAWTNTGTLPADPVRFPRGLKPVGDRCHENGMKLLLWFEPERIRLCMADPSYEDGFILRLKDETVLDTVRLVGISRRLVDGMGLLNLADRHCQDVIIDKIDGLIKEYGVDIYRQDFNFPPLCWWLQNDEEGRLGMTENLYVQGYLRLFSELLRRNPGLWINQVASGGRRSDLETLRLSVSLHQSDYGHGQHPVHQAIRSYSFAWQGYCGSFLTSNDGPDGEYDYQAPFIRPEGQNGIDNFMFHNSFCPEMMAGAAVVGFSRIDSTEQQPDHPGYLDCYRHCRDLFYRAAPYTLNSDFYVLKQTDRTNRCWYAVQFHREETGDGIVQAIRNTCCEEESIVLSLRQIDPEKTYVFESPEFDRCVTVSGKELETDGFKVMLPKRTGEIWFYHSYK